MNAELQQHSKYIIFILHDDDSWHELFSHTEKFKINQFMNFWKMFRPLTKIHVVYEPLGENTIRLFNNEAREWKGI